MGRLFVYLAVIATVIGFIVSDAGGRVRPHEPGHAIADPTTGADRIGWAAGLVMGYALAWVTRIDWATFPERFGAWMQLMRHRIWWMAFGGICAGFLLFF